MDSLVIRVRNSECQAARIQTEEIDSCFFPVHGA